MSAEAQRCNADIESGGLDDGNAGAEAAGGNDSNAEIESGDRARADPETIQAAAGVADDGSRDDGGKPDGDDDDTNGGNGGRKGYAGLPGGKA